MDMSLQEIITLKNIQVPSFAGGEDGGGAKKNKLGGWLKRSATGMSGAQRKHQKRAANLAGVTKKAQGAGRKFSGSSEPTKLIISNLDYKLVTDFDIATLFGELGKLKKAEVHYDKNGQSQGSAEVIYERHADAMKAMSLFNGERLDGRPMVIQIAVSELNPPVFDTTRLGGKNGRGNTIVKNKLNQNGVTQRNGGKWCKEEPSIDELDAELEEYIKNRI